MAPGQALGGSALRPALASSAAGVMFFPKRKLGAPEFAEFGRDPPPRFVGDRHFAFAPSAKTKLQSASKMDVPGLP